MKHGCVVLCLFFSCVLQGRELGRGLYGITRHAKHRKSGELFACKSINKVCRIPVRKRTAAEGKESSRCIYRQPVDACKRIKKFFPVFLVGGSRGD